MRCGSQRYVACAFWATDTDPHHGALAMPVSKQCLPALIAAGLGIIVNIKRRLAAILSGAMIFIWFVILHIPRAIADPHSGKGNEWTSVFEALAFSGIAFLIASQSKKQPK